ncbi:MAG: hypothetical protein KAS66_07645 [Candidatus Omnitrophica bacterium]|nr:hypothetical protein [Candidatus Omnitrophota bacterium]
MKRDLSMYPQGEGAVRVVRTFGGKEFEYGRTFDSFDIDQIDIYKEMMKKLGYNVRSVWDGSVIHIYTRLNKTEIKRK